MASKIEKDHARWKQIVRGKVRKELKKYISHPELIGKKGDRIVTIPLPRIELPRFKFDFRKTGGVGQGDGDIGTPVGAGPDQDGDKAGNMPGEHAMEVELTFDELLDIIDLELELPNLEQRGKNRLIAEKTKYTGIAKAGPESLRHFKRTYKEALKRLIMSGWKPGDPIVPVREDKRYRSWKIKTVPESHAVIIYMMDASSSMGPEQKELVRLTAFWIKSILERKYDKLEQCFVLHDVNAKEVDEETFFHLRESGGTKISSALIKAKEMIAERFSPEDYNIYLFLFSDGENWNTEDTELCVETLGHELLPIANLFGYGEVKGSHRVKGEVHDAFKKKFGEEAKNICLRKIDDKDDIWDTIRAFLKRRIK